MVNIISDYIPPFSPLPNIAPFTYKDGETYLSTLDRLRTYCNTVLVDFINTNFTALSESFTTEVNTLIAQVNGLSADLQAEVEAQLAAQNIAITDQLNTQNLSITNQLNTQNDNITGQLAAQDDAVASMISNGITQINTIIADFIANQDSAVALLVNTPTSETKIALDGQFTTEAYVNNANAAQDDALDTNVTAIVTNPISTTRVELDTLYGGGGSGGASDASVAGYVSDPASLTRAELDTLYSGGGSGGLDDAGVAGLVNNDASATKVALDSKFVEQVATGTRIYGTSNTGMQQTYGVDSNASSTTIPIRDSSGRIKVGVPIDFEHAASKQYVDGFVKKAAVGNVLYGNDATQVPITYPVTTFATANTVAQRSVGGVLTVGEPTSGSHSATKNYVDNIGVNVPTASTIMRRDANGRSQVASPSVGNDIVNLTTLNNAVAAIVPLKVPEYADAAAINSGIPAPIVGQMAKSLVNNVIYKYIDDPDWGNVWIPWESDGWLDYTPGTVGIFLGTGSNKGRYRFSSGFIYNETLLTFDSATQTDINDVVQFALPVGIRIDNGSSIDESFNVGQAIAVLPANVVVTGFLYLLGAGGSLPEYTFNVKLQETLHGYPVLSGTTALTEPFSSIATFLNGKVTGGSSYFI